MPPAKQSATAVNQRKKPNNTPTASAANSTSTDDASVVIGNNRQAEIELQNRSQDSSSRQNDEADGMERGRYDNVSDESSNTETKVINPKHNCIRGLWRTRLTEPVEGNRELYVKTTLRELAIYIVFIIILSIITFGMTSPKMYYYNKTMFDLFVDGDKPKYQDIGNANDFWDWAEGNFLDGLYWDTYYNDDPVPKDKQGYIFFENKILGRPRLRQLRVGKDSCKVHDDFKNEIEHCYASYSENSEYKNSFGICEGKSGEECNGDTNGDTNMMLNESTAWRFYDEEALDGRSAWGKISTYGGGGYVQLLPNISKAEATTVLANLKKNKWIDRGTRAVMIDFTTYNPNLNYFCIVKLVLEFPATGGIFPSSNIWTLKLLRYVSGYDYFIMACEFIFAIFLLYYVVEEAIEIKINGFKYFKSVWNVLDLLVILLGFLAIIFQGYRIVKVDNILVPLLTKSDQYANFENLGFWQARFNEMVAVTIFFAWIKIFKYISFNKTMQQLQGTLVGCAADIAGFAIMFFIVFLAYVQWGYLIFGTMMQDFSSYINAM